jgi:hypothetical protein
MAIVFIPPQNYARRQCLCFNVLWLPAQLSLAEKLLLLVLAVEGDWEGGGEGDVKRVRCGPVIVAHCISCIVGADQRFCYDSCLCGVSATREVTKLLNDVELAIGFILVQFAVCGCSRKVCIATPSEGYSVVK